MEVGADLMDTPFSDRLTKYSPWFDDALGLFQPPGGVGGATPSML